MSEGVLGALLLAPVGLPLLGAALAAMLRASPALQRTVMEASVAAMAVASVALFVAAQQQAMVLTFGGWPRPFGISFVGDPLGTALSLATALIGVAAAVYARADVAARRRRAGFDPLLLAMLAAVNGAFLTGDLFNLYVWFELILVCALGLVTLDRRRAQIDGALRYGVISIVGATFILIGVALVYGETGSLDMAHVAGLLEGRAPSVTLVAAGALLFAGFALKAGLFPFFFWLPASYHTAPITAVAVFAGLLTKVGFYACLRVLVTLFGIGGLPGMPTLFAAIAGATMLVCVMGALGQSDLRRILSFHIIAQVGYMMIGLAVATGVGVQAAIFYMIHSIIVQANLFFVAGAIGRATGGYDLRNTGGGLAKTQPVFAMLVAVPMLSLAGIPPFSGFWAKLVTIDAAFEAALGWLGIVALVAGFLTIISMGNVWSKAFWKPLQIGRLARRVPLAMVFAIGLLSTATLAIGLAPDALWLVAGGAAEAMGALP